MFLNLIIKTIKKTCFGKQNANSDNIWQEHSNLFTEHYDAVVASEIIEHVDNKEIFIQACVKAVKPGGKIFITTPNRTRAMQLFGIIIAENITKSLPRGTHEYDKFITPNEVTFMLERSEYLYKF